MSGALLGPVRRLFGMAALIAAGAGALSAEEAPHLNSFGLPGLIDMPNGQPLPPDSLSLTLFGFDGEYRTTLAYQITPRITGVFRYIALPGADYFDRSFDLHVLLAEEGEIMPAVRLGLVDFGGTGLFSSEYVAATKEIAPGLELTGGIGWGRLAGRGAFANPLARIDDYFADRPEGRTIEDTGRIRADVFFRGDAALFGGVRWTPTDQLSFAAEYSSDTYPFEGRRLGFTQDSPLNVSASYRFANGGELTAAYLYGNTIGISYGRTFFPGNTAIPGGTAAAPPPLVPRQSAEALGWTLPASAPVRGPDLLELSLGTLGLGSQGLTVNGSEAVLRLENPTYFPPSQAIGRAARVMANTLPASVETLVIVPVVAGMPTSEIRLRRSDLEALEYDLDGAWLSYARADISDAADQPVLEGTGFRWALAPILRRSYFDPDAPLRLEAGLALSASYNPTPGLFFSGQIYQPLLGNLDSIRRRSNSILPHVRSDSALYAVETETEITWATVEQFFRPGPNLYGRMTVGILEQMYGGASAELLWRPASSRLALGAEVNYAVQRDFDGLGFRDYDVITGHASAYYDMENGYTARIDAGRYLAGDWGATFTLDRVFANGASVGAFFTLTDVSFDDFGEGAFDKGIVISLPVQAIAGTPSRVRITEVFRPVLRDGGARLNVRNRLYDLTAEYGTPQLGESWGRFWR
ncbi:YjbH domain-containing protein [Pseudoroseicyclus sp. CXY001]|uniref:YjbH domain-containing protein n=1 Tax=Pseudoroseicyclus sp. CXY001 TaxID=3242492 RepID=UPI003570CED9